MNSGVIAQLLTAAGFGGVIAAVINYFGQRRKVGADTAVVLSGEARAWASQAMERVVQAETRVESANKRADTAEEMARTCRDRVRQLEDYIEELYDIMESSNLKPPPMPPRSQ